MKTCLIITSCIYPFSSFVKPTDPKEREKLHIDALKRWIVETDIKDIIICDNSGYQYADEYKLLAENHLKRLEILTFYGDKDKSLRFGKGYGEGAIVAANSVVVHDVETFSIVGGNPAKFIKKRFDEDSIKILLNLDYEKIMTLIDSTNIELFYKEISKSSDVSSIVNQIGLN